jgi:5-methylcytosine-specific restriction endonuclease McrA
MNAYKIPNAQQQLEFLKKIQRLIDEGDFSATYKYALLAALVELAVEQGDDSGAPLALTLREIAEKFAEIYWPQTAPYISRQPGTKKEVLVQNRGKQAAIINYLLALRNGGARTVVEAKKHPGWGKQISKIASVVRNMPVGYLQNMGGISVFFLYDLPESGNPLMLKPGVAYSMRRFQAFVQQLVRAGWVSHVRGNRDNVKIIGEADDLETFMFHPNRCRLNEVSEFLRDYDGAKCFYCGNRLRETVEVDHFIPWSHYPKDTGHNFVLAHKSCNGKKGDTLAASNHLAHWIDRNTQAGDDFRESLEQMGFMVDWLSSKTITRWAYRQGIDLESRAWVSGDLYEPVNNNYIHLLS